MDIELQSSLEANQHIISQFHQLAEERQMFMVSELTQPERRALLDVMLKTGKEVQEQMASSLCRHIDAAKYKDTSLSRIDCRRSVLKSIGMQVGQLYENAVYQTGFLTEHRVLELVKAEQRSRESRAPGSSISQEELLEVLREYRRIPEGERVSLGTFLTEQGFSKEISELHFKAKTFEGLNISDVVFSRCHFSYTHFNDIELTNVSFNQCQLENVSFLRTRINGCHFTGSHLQEVLFIGSELDRVLFKHCSLKGGSFESSTIENCRFISVEMPRHPFFASLCLK